MAEQFPSVAEVAVLDQGAAEELSSSALVERFIDSRPPTHGIVEGSLADAPDGVYLSPNVVAENRGVLPEFIEITMLPGAQLGAADSHHGVVFGRVAVRAGEQISLEPVAIKEFTTDSDKGLQEHDALVAAKERGFEAFEPLAMARDGEHTYLITRKRDEVTSMDNEDWSISPSDSERYAAEVVPNLHYMAESLARMHSKGIFHGDAQPKNFMRTDTGELVAGDLEDAEIAYTEDELVQMVSGGWEPRDSKALSDVWHCWYAMTHPINGDNPDETVKSVVFLEQEDYDTCMREFEVNFLDPYLAALEKHSDPTNYEKFGVDELRSTLHSRVAMTT